MQNIYKQVFESCVEGILVVQKGEIVLTNPSCESLFGYQKNEMIGLTVEDLLPKEIQAKHIKLREEYSKNPTPRHMGDGGDFMGRKKDDSLFPVEISLNPTTIQGTPSMIAYIIDISTREKVESQLKESEEQLKEYALKLEERVQDRTWKMDNANQRLSKVNRKLKQEVADRVKAENEATVALGKEKELSELKTRFVSMASHEFRTPLSTVMLSASLLSRYITKENEDKKLKHINRIKSNVVALTDVLNDFLSLDLLTTGKLPVAPQLLSVKNQIQSVVAEMRGLLKARQILVTSFGFDQCQFNTDFQILKKILLNLLSNAIKYSPKQSTISVRVQANKYQMSIAIVDQGMGIPKEEQIHLFERFFRAHNVAHIQGTGLGLNIVKKYVELIDGTITFSSIEGKGTTFTVTISYNKK